MNHLAFTIKTAANEKKALLADGYMMTRSEYKDHVQHWHFLHTRSGRELDMYIYMRVGCWQLYCGSRLLKKFEA